MAAKVRSKKTNGRTFDRSYYTTTINKEIVRRLKSSGLPMFIELARCEDQLDIGFRRYGFVSTLIGKGNLSLYDEAVIGSIIAEVAKLTKDALTSAGVTYPGMWTDYVIQNVGWSILHRVVTTEGKRFLIVDTIDNEESRKGAPWPEMWSNNDAYSCPPSARVAYDDYTPELMTAFVLGFSAAITGRIALLSIDKYTPHTVFTADGTVVQKYARFVKDRIGEDVTNWVYNVCDADDDIIAQVKSMSNMFIPPFVDLVAALASTGGVNVDLIRKIMSGVKIAPSFDTAKFDDIEDPNLEIICTMSRPGKDKVHSSAFKITPVHILRLCCDKKPTVTASRMVGRMVKDAITSMIILCTNVAADGFEDDVTAGMCDTPSES